MIFDKLTELDKSAIQAYIDNYATRYEIQSCNKVSLDRVLAEWNACKEDLFHKFGDKFIVSFPIAYKESYYEIENKLEETLWDSCDNFGKFYTALKKHYPYRYINYNEDPEITAPLKQQNIEHYLFTYLFSNSCLSRNKFIYDGLTDEEGNELKEYSLTLKDGKSFKFQRGIKPMKVIKKLAESWGVEGFEDFRNAHSRCLQTKEVKGELCLSIHPLDYMTMSDNNHEWETCMSWRNNGEYKIGTIEMMNSPTVIVAYFKSDSTNMHFCDYTWNSKKWRCLFIVDNNFILSIKQYPYENSNLIKTATTKIAELIGWGSIQPTNYNYNDSYRRSNATAVNNDKTFFITTKTGGMYNDFGRTGDGHWVIVNPAADSDEIGYDDYCYSGKATCMNCGETLWIEEEGDEAALTCSNMSGCLYLCDCCGEQIHFDETRYVQGENICYDCYLRDAVYDNFDEENIWKDNAFQIILSLDEETLIVPKSRFEERSAFINDKYILEDNTLDIKFKEELINPNKPLKYSKEANAYWLAPNDLTPRGLRIFGIYSSRALQEFMAFKK